MKAWTSLNFGKICSLTTELIALECLKKSMNIVGTTLAPLFLFGSSSFLQVTGITIKSQVGSKFEIKSRTAELAASKRLEKSSQTYNWINVVTTLVPSFLDGSSSFLQVTRTTIKAWMTLNLVKFHHRLRSELPLSVLKMMDSVVTTLAPSI